MNRVLMFGATGHAGLAIARELNNQGYDFTAVVRNQNGVGKLRGLTQKILIREVTDERQLDGICTQYDIVISALGKSVSPNERSKSSFYDIDYVVNKNILEQALSGSVKKFIYLSAFHSEQYLHLEYFRVHHEFSELLKQSGLDYSIIKPPAIFSAFRDMIPLAEKGRLMTIGKGDKKTNPIAEEDLAIICVQAIRQPFSVIEAGGPEILTRKQINNIIQAIVDDSKKVRSIPLGLIKFFLPVIRVIDKNSYDKFAFFTAVMQDDTIAPQMGGIRLEEYMRRAVKRQT